MSRPARYGRRLVLGVDVGGTKIEVVAARASKADASDLEIVARERTWTPRDGYDAIVERVARFADEVATKAGFRHQDFSVGVGMPGSITSAGLVKNSNTTCLNGRPFRSDLVSAMNRPIAFDNDANLFALAETRMGAAKAHAKGVVFGAILGTGVGGGIVARGEVWPGAMGVAGEWGHHAVWAGSPDARPCYCGQRGCVEAHLAGPALVQQYHERKDDDGDTVVVQDIVGARGFDPVADQVVEAMLATFARGLANVIDILDPTAIVLGGGLSNIPCFYGEGRDRVAALAFTDRLATPILKNACGDSAGVLGAALLAASSAD